MKTIDETRYFLFCFFRHFFKFFSEILFYLLLRSYKTILAKKKVLKDNKQYFDEILCISLIQFKQISSLIFPKPHFVINLMFKILKVQRHELLNIFFKFTFLTGRTTLISLIFMKRDCHIGHSLFGLVCGFFFCIFVVVLFNVFHSFGCNRNLKGNIVALYLRGFLVFNLVQRFACFNIHQ